MIEEPKPKPLSEIQAPWYSLPRLLPRVLFLLFLLGLFAPAFLFSDDTFRLGLFAKYMALAILALGVDLVWGYAGLLSLGQGLFFGLGAYSMGYCLELQQAAAEVNARPGTVPPNFMQFTNLPVTHPDYHAPAALKWIAPLSNTYVALAAAILLPGLVATAFGWVSFRFRIRGVYFALITQALLLAGYSFFYDQIHLTGGFVGIKNLADLQIFGMTFNPYRYVLPLYFLTAGTLLVCFLGCFFLVRTRFGKILTAIRDNENRVLALGYNTALYKTFVFGLAGTLSGLAGALFVAANALCGPEYMGIAFSIEAVIFVAVGGRGTLFGAIIGAVLVNMAKSYISEASPYAWTMIVGILFIAVVVFMPEGIVGLVRRLVHRFRLLVAGRTTYQTN